MEVKSESYPPSLSISLSLSPSLSLSHYIYIHSYFIHVYSPIRRPTAASQFSLSTLFLRPKSVLHPWEFEFIDPKINLHEFLEQLQPDRFNLFLSLLRFRSIDFTLIIEQFSC